MKRRFDLYLKDILRAISNVKEYTDKMSFGDFNNNQLIIDATLRNLEIVGEASTQLQKEVKDKYPEIPWKNLISFRIIVAHKYWEMNKERIWDIIQNKLDKLKEQIQEVLEKESKRS